MSQNWSWKSLGSLWAIINALSVGSDVLAKYFTDRTSIYNLDVWKSLGYCWEWKKITQAGRSVAIWITSKIQYLVESWSENDVTNPLSRWHVLFFRCLLTSPSFPIFNWQINLDNCVLVSCLLMSSVKKNNYLACSLNFTLNLACCSVDYLSPTVHFCVH